MKLKDRFVGLDTYQETYSGNAYPLTYFDSAATTLGFKSTLKVIDSTLKHYSNVHSHNSFNALRSRDSLQDSIESIFDFFEVPKEKFEIIFQGNGATAGIQFFAELLNSSSAQKKTIIVSEMEHVSNDVLHRPLAEKVVYIPTISQGQLSGSVDTEKLISEIKKHKDDIRYVSITAMSNVTGIINPIDEISIICRKFGIPLLLDIAQLAANSPISIKALTKWGRVDGIAFSGHKLYAPGSPGVLIVNRQHLKKPLKLGGGTIKRSSKYHFETFDNDFSLHHAGTLNLVAINILSNALKELTAIGLQRIEQHHFQLTKYILKKFSSIEDIVVYGGVENANRLSCIPFNINGVPPDLLACFLNDYYNISVRSGCFCAHSYVHALQSNEHLNRNIDGLSDREAQAELVKHRGMVRVSLGIYNDIDDINFLIDALRDFINKKHIYISQYIYLGEGKHQHINMDNNKDLSCIDHVQN